MSGPDQPQPPVPARLGQLMAAFARDKMEAVTFHPEDPNAQAIESAAAGAGLRAVPDVRVTFREVRGLPVAPPEPEPLADEVIGGGADLPPELLELAESLMRPVAALLDTARPAIVALLRTVYQQGRVDGLRAGFRKMRDAPGQDRQ